MSRRQRAADLLDMLMAHAYEAGAASKDPFAREYQERAHWNSAKELKDHILDLWPGSVVVAVEGDEEASR